MTKHNTVAATNGIGKILAVLKDRLVMVDIMSVTIPAKYLRFLTY